ncbi:HAMP domain-containing histidine kinase, partial [bacterium]|nr:HAMP domain-containing histidine kinase [bacterium]
MGAGDRTQGSPTLRADSGRLLALHERILRRSYGAGSYDSALQGVASELSAEIPHRACCLEAVDAQCRPLRRLAVWPGGDGAALAPVAGTDTSGEQVSLVGGGRPVTSGTRPGWHLSFLAPSGMEYEPRHQSLLRNLAPSLEVAFEVSAAAPESQAQLGGAGVEPLEMLDLVCGALAHDVRNILGGILGAIELHRVGGGSEEAVFDALRRRAVEGVATVDAMTARLRGLSQGRESCLDLAQVVGEVAQDARGILASCGDRDRCEITLDLETGWARVDPSAMRRAVAAVVFNAVRATRDGGRVEIRTGTRRTRAFVEVRDEGVGLPQEALHLVRQPFYTSAPDCHWGLGLTIAEGVVRRAGGSLGLQAAPGSGTT